MKNFFLNCFYLNIIIFIFLISFSTNTFSQSIILVLGDSLTEGFGVKKEEAFPFLIEKELLDKGFDIKIINAGVSGSTSASAYSRLKWHFRSSPEIVILALGGNDGLRGLSIDSLKKNLSKTIKLAQFKKIKILLAGMQMPLNYGKEYTDSFREVYYELSREHNVPLVPFLLKDVGGVPNMNQIDGIHPNRKGHQIMAKTVLKYLEPLLLKK